jgi:hypothetical protein
MDDLRHVENRLSVRRIQGRQKRENPDQERKPQ